MHFIIISRENKDINEFINNNYLNSAKAPSLIADNVKKIEIGNFTVYLYLYNQITEETERQSYYFDEDKLLISNGIYNLNGNTVKDIKKTFENLKNDYKLSGDYQLISIDKKGNGFFKTPKFSLRQLFFYEDENCKVLSTEIKLIVDGVQKFKEKKFVENYDLDFFYDSIYNEWGKRKFPKNTIFKNIKRVFPHDEKCFKEGKIIISRNKNINIPILFKNQFNSNRELLYNQYYSELINFTEKNLELIKISSIRLGLTGGFDSRLAVAILHKICNKLKIKLICHTSGKKEHPDVIIAKEICKTLDIEHEHNIPNSGKGVYPQKNKEYMRSFYNFQGDRNSNDYWPINRKIEKSNSMNHLGMDAFKRYNMNLIYSGNRWFAKSILFRNNFFFPLFYTEKEIFFALSYGKGKDWSSDYKEFIYEILKRSEPGLLKVPFVGDSLPQADVEAFSKIELSKFHEKIPFLWDYKYVKKNLSFILKKNLDKKVGIKGKSFLSIIGLNELDFFLNPRIYKILKKYRMNKISMLRTIKILLKEKSKEIYPKNREFVEIKENDKNKILKRKMVILMDYASAASINSFEEIENIVFEKN
ncbi:MAG: hypothetical protein LBQ59_01110 [Candidatus Peribacteria bacterium]|jgi:hypothetical protein|nr:hypothetical protein [Candidatus Peribacteria bacterium]